VLLLSWCRQDRKSLKARQQQLSKEVSEKKLSEAKFREHCGLLEKQLSELVGVVEQREAEFAIMVQKIEAMDKEGVEDKMAAEELRVELEKAEEQRTSLEEKVQTCVCMCVCGCMCVCVCRVGS